MGLNNGYQNGTGLGSTSGSGGASKWGNSGSSWNGRLSEIIIFIIAHAHFGRLTNQN